jgi:hypothetical protein
VALYKPADITEGVSVQEDSACCWDVDWIPLAQNKTQLQAHLMALRLISIKSGNFVSEY